MFGVIYHWAASDTFDSSFLCIIITWEHMITFSATFSNEGPIKGLTSSRVRHRSARHPITLDGLPGSTQGWILGLPSLHSEILVLPQDPRHQCCCRDILYVPSDSSQLCHIAQPSATYRKSKQAGCCSAQRGRGKKDFFQREWSIYRRAHQKSKGQRSR